MSTMNELDFQPVPLRSGVWKAEVTGMIYSIFQSTSGFVVHCGKLRAGGNGDTPIGGAPRGLHPTLEAAIHACNAHYRRLIS